MELEKLWNNFSETTNEYNISEENISESKTINSKAPLQKIHRILKLKLGWGILFTVLSAALLITHSKNLSIALLFTFAMIYFVASTVYTKYKMNKSKLPEAEQNTKQYLLNYYKQVSSLLKSEEISSIFLIPVFTIIGILYGSALFYGSMASAFSEPNILILAVVLLITIVPITIIFVKWSNKVAFGSYLKQLQSFIHSLEEK